MFTRRTSRLIGATAAIAVAALSSSCSDDDSDALHVYSGRHYGIEKAFEQFTKDTGIKVVFLTGNDGELRERIAAEGDETKADAYITVDAGNLAAAAAQGLFQPVDSPVVAQAMPAELSDPDGLWYGLTVRVRTIVYNTDLLAAEDVPGTYEELAEPSWRGRVCMRNSTSVYQQSLVASLIAAHGEEEALRIVNGWADNAEIFATDELILDALADGLCEVGVTNHYYLARRYDEDPTFPVGLVWANQDDRGAHVNVSGGGVTKHSRHPEEAQRFLEWLATEGQNVLIGDNHELPANPAIEPDQVLIDRFGVDFLADPLDAATIGSLNADAVRLMDEAGYE